MKSESNKMISVIIVTAGRGDYLKACLESLHKQTYPDLDIMVIDNSPGAAVGREVIKSYPKIKLYSGGQNLFYCQALNQGIQMSKGDFILCLNDDVILTDRFIEEALKGFFYDTKVGMVSGKILRGDGKTIDSTGLSPSFWRTARERGYGSYDRGNFEKEGFVFGVNGAAAFYRREMLEDIKEDNDYFDSDFRIFYEDLDVSWRAERAGWRGYYIPGAIAYHIRGGTIRAGSGIDRPCARRFLSCELEADLIKNRYLAVIKNESALNFLLHLPGMLLYDLIVWSYILFFRPPVIRIFFLNLKYLKKALRKRAINIFSRR
jgi:GT2 family glycosyltransferase